MATANTLNSSFGSKYPGGSGGLAPRRRSFIARHPSVLIFLACLAIFTIGVTILAEGFGIGVISTSFVKTLGKTLCLCLVALAMDLVWGYCGILSLGHMAFFGIGGYAIGMWLMYARTEFIVAESLRAAPLPPTPQEISDGIATQIFGVVGASEFPPIWAFAHSLPLQLAAGCACAGAAGAGLWLAGLPQPGDGRVPFDPDAGDDTRAVALPFSE